jgi:hypothetical protein
MVGVREEGEGGKIREEDCGLRSCRWVVVRLGIVAAAQ